MNDPATIACRMDSLSAGDRARRSEVLSLLTPRTLEVVDTGDGIAFVLGHEPDTVALAGEFIGYESRCCPFVRFALTVEADGGAVRLAMGGGEGVAEFLRATFGPKRI